MDNFQIEKKSLITFNQYLIENGYESIYQIEKNNLKPNYNYFNKQFFRYKWCSYI